jgi:hypothetical protein
VQLWLFLSCLRVLSGNSSSGYASRESKSLVPEDVMVTRALTAKHRKTLTSNLMGVSVMVDRPDIPLCGVKKNGCKIRNKGKIVSAGY